MDLFEKADNVYREHFPMETCFERAVFFSWACKLENCCSYCYMSTLPKDKRTSDRVRSFGSLLAETLLCKVLGWDYGFLSGGIGVFSDEKLISLLKNTVAITGEPIWVNIGTQSKEQLEIIKPYIKGVVGSIEVLDAKLHKEICPDKPIEPVVEMFEAAKELGLERAMTLIIGLGETIDDFPLLEAFIKKHGISKIHLYGLNPQIGTPFEHSNPPSAEYQAEWIAKTRIAFPDLDIQCGVWADRVDRIGQLLRAGANSISKLPAFRIFGKDTAKEIEAQSAAAGRAFNGTLTKLPDIDFDKEVDKLPFESDLKEEVRDRLHRYLKRLRK